MRPTSSDSGRQRGIRAVPPAREAGAIEDLIILARAGAPFEQALERILRATIRSFDAEAAGLYLLDERARRLKPRLAATFEPDGVVRLGRPPGDGIRLAPLDRGDPLLRALATGRVQLVEDTRTLAGVAILKTMPEGRSPGGMVAVLPLLAFEQNIGVLFIRSPAGGLRASDRVLLEAFVNEVGQAIERSSIPAVDGAGLRITLLNRAALDLQSDIASDRIFCKIVHGAVEALGVRRGILCLFDHERGVLTGKAAVDRDAPDEGESFRRMVEKLSIPVTDPDEVLAATVLDRRSFALPPAAGHGEQPTRATALPEELRRSDLLVTPLTAGPVVVGVLALFGRPDRGSPTDDLYWLRAFAAHAGHATLRAMAGRHFSDSESRYRRFVEESPDGIVETTLDGRILFCNDAAPRLLGCTREELLRRNARSFYVHPEQRDELIKLNDQRGRVESMDVSVKRQDGTISHVSLSTRLSQGPDGPLLRVSFRDVSERHELERRMRLLVDAVTYSADAIVSLDPSGKIVSWNQGAEAIYGYSAEEMIGEPYQVLVPDDLMDEFCNVIRVKAEEQGHLQAYETYRLHKDGHRVPVSITVTRLRSTGSPDLGWSIVVRDISERKKAERHRRLLSSITEQSPDAILSVDLEGTVTSWNRGAEKMFGFSATEMMGRCWLSLVPPDKEPALRRVMRSRRRDAAGGMETFARIRSGRLIPVRLSVSVLESGGEGPDGWSIIFRDLTEQRNLAEMSKRLREELYSRDRPEGIVGNSRAIAEVRDRVRKVARFNSSVLLVGESGTGKEIVANAIHYHSPRREGPFIKVNCAAIPEHLLESELFGIERNVATGVDGRIGRFEMADGGTLFLDEIGDMSLATQAKILRVLQEREFERVGGKQVIKVDVRIIAATNKDLAEEIPAKRFRNDLYYRLNVIVIVLPPLADRREDIDPLIDHFLAKFTRENNLSQKHISLQTRILLNRYGWPGNVRELEHCIERAVVMSEGVEITEDDLPPAILIWREQERKMGMTDGARNGLSDVLQQVERRTVVNALERTGWIQARAARVLGISERSMWYRVKKLGLKPHAAKKPDRSSHGERSDAGPQRHGLFRRDP